MTQQYQVQESCCKHDIEGTETSYNKYFISLVNRGTLDMFFFVVFFAWRLR